jgi:Uma2 family endonuclease
MESTTTATAKRQIVYPESDGKPMAETDVHIDALIYLREALRDHFRETPQVYVAGNLLLYYEEGNPSACVAPDVFVVKGVSKHERRTYRLWEEGQAPVVAFEITSRGTRLEDLGNKRALYAMLGIAEYYLYDPLGEYLQPSLQGYRLQAGEYQRLPLQEVGVLRSAALGLEIRVEAGRLLVVNPETGERLLSPAQAQESRRTETAARQAAEAQVAREVAAREAAEARATEAEAELERLRAELARRREESP